MTLIRESAELNRRERDKIEYLTPGSPVNYSLLSTGVIAGDSIKVINGGTATVTVLSSNAATVTTILAGADATFIALVSSPTAPANFKAISTVRAPGSQVTSSTGAGFGSTANKIRRFSSNVTIGTAITCSGNDTTNGTTYTINEDGVYGISYVDRNGAAATMLAISINSTQLTTAPDSLNAADVLTEIYQPTTNTRAYLGVSAVRLVAGDVIRPHTDGNPNETTYAKFIITQIART